MKSICKLLKFVLYSFFTIICKATRPIYSFGVRSPSVFGLHRGVTVTDGCLWRRLGVILTDVLAACD